MLRRSIKTPNLKMAVERTNRLNELVKRALSKIIQKEFLPEKYGWITLSRVIVSGDIQHARVFLTVMAGNEKATLEKLRIRQPHIRHLLANSVRLRFTPELIFEIDEDLKQALKVDKLIDNVAAETHQDDA